MRKKCLTATKSRVQWNLFWKLTGRCSKNLLCIAQQWLKSTEGCLRVNQRTPSMVLGILADRFLSRTVFLADSEQL